MMKRIRLMKSKTNQKGLAVIEYVIVLAVVAALAALVFGGDNSISGDVKSMANKAKNDIGTVNTQIQKS